jgi:hypothetical protein
MGRGCLCSPIYEFSPKRGLVWKGLFSFLFSVSNFWVFEMNLVQIPRPNLLEQMFKKLECFQKPISAQTQNSPWFLKKFKLKTKITLPKQGHSTSSNFRGTFLFYP